MKSEVSIEESKENWREKGEFRFYYSQFYDKSTKEILNELPQEAENYNRSKGKGSKVKGSMKDKKSIENDGEYPKVDRKLNCLDIFAGCGGLTKGLEQAGICDSKWAIEAHEPAAKAYKANFPSTEVFNEDCNLLLKGNIFNSL